MNSAPEVREPAAEALVRLARGFSCVFWGLPLSLLLFSGALNIRVLPRVRVPAYLLGVLVLYGGVLFLHRAPPLTRRWRRRIHQALFLLMLQVYLSPFVQWWRAMPREPYYLANVMLLLTVTVWTFFALNLLAGEVGRGLGDAVLRVEASACGWVSVIGLLLPSLYSTARFYHAMIRMEYEAVFPFLLHPAVTPRWLYAVALLPFTLTMVMAWRAKELCLRRLRGRPEPAAAGEEIPASP